MDRDSDELEESLQLPIQGLFADLSCGEASLGLCDEVLALKPLLRARLAEQWLVSLRRFHRDAMDELFAEQLRRNPRLSRDEQLQLFKSTCAAFGLDSPRDREC